MDKGSQVEKSAEIRFFKAGQRIIIEIDGAEDHFDQAALNFISAFLGKPLSENKLDVQPIIQGQPAPTPRDAYFEDMILTGGTYKGISANQALQKHREKALVELYHYAKTLQDPDEKEAVCVACKKYMSTSLKERKELMSNEEDMDEFIRTVTPIVDMRKMLQMFTYQNLDDFLAAADLDEKRLAFESIVESLIQRGNQ